MKTHQKSTTRLYQVWQDMKNRCLNKQYRLYKDYGGRGIQIDFRWFDFEGFAEDVNRSYDEHVLRFGTKDTFIDRIDNEGNYTKKNVRWVTRGESNKNRRMQKLSREKVAEIRKRYVYGNGGALAKEFGVCRGIISEIVNRKRNYANI